MSYDNALHAICKANFGAFYPLNRYSQTIEHRTNLYGFHKIYLQDYDYYERDRYDDNRDLFERRYSGMGSGNSSSLRGAGGNGGRDFVPMRREPMPLPPSLGSMRGMGGFSGNSLMRGISGSSGGNSGGYDSVFSRRSPPRSGNGRFR